MKGLYVQLLRVTYGWSSFLVPDGSRDLWQAAVYLTPSWIFVAFLLVVGPLDQYVADGNEGHVCALVGLASLLFNYRFAMKNADAIRRKGSMGSALLAYAVVLTPIAAGLVAVFYP
jgi:hypothetical protein